MLLIYKALSFLLLPFTIIIFYLHPRGRVSLMERLGIWPQITEPVIWLHAASIGEVNGLIPFINKIKQRDENLKILMTTTSSTGRDLANKFVDYALLAPFDNYLCLKLALRRIDIKLYIIAETELWPNLIEILAKKNIPVIIVNAIISDFTFNTYYLLKPLFRKVLNNLKFVFTSSNTSHARFLALGVDISKLKNFGNMKYDNIEVAKQAIQNSKLSKIVFKKSLKTIVLGSIRPGEEVVWFNALLKFPNKFNVIIAPRHPEKFDYFANELKKYNIEFKRYSDITTSTAEINSSFILLDQMGLLMNCYEIADLAFVGATLIDKIGGHNPLEPAALSKWVVLGQYYSKVRELVNEMASQEACTIIYTQKDIENLLLKLLESDHALVYGKKSYEFYKSQIGATEKVFGYLLQQKVL
jgi:3-deoxy-D-manno-octulosonic-acid transferase